MLKGLNKKKGKLILQSNEQPKMEVEVKPALQQHMLK